MSEHNQLTDSSIHTPYRWIWADTAARGSETDIESRDVNKVGLQADNNSLWLLEDLTPTWSQIGVIEQIITASPSTPYAVDWAAGTLFEITLGQNTTFTFSNLAAGRSVTLVLIQDATGSRTVTWPAGVDWPSGVAPTLSTGANAVDVITLFVRADGATVIGLTAGLDLQ